MYDPDTQSCNYKNARMVSKDDKNYDPTNPVNRWCTPTDDGMPKPQYTQLASCHVNIGGGVPTKRQEVQCQEGNTDEKWKFSDKLGKCIRVPNSGNVAKGSCSTCTIPQYGSVRTALGKMFPIVTQYGTECYNDMDRWHRGFTWYHSYLPLQMYPAAKHLVTKYLVSIGDETTLGNLGRFLRGKMSVAGDWAVKRLPNVALKFGVKAGSLLGKTANFVTQSGEVFTPLVYGFANGVLHPKTYAQVLGTLRGSC